MKFFAMEAQPNIKNKPNENSNLSSKKWAVPSLVFVICSLWTDVSTTATRRHRTLSCWRYAELRSSRSCARWTTDIGGSHTVLVPYGLFVDEPQIGSP